MAIKCAWASIDENGKARGGKAGDQTKKEVKVGTWYNFGQNVIIRPKTATMANKIASNMKAIANNDNVGYDQNERQTMYNAWKKLGITKSPSGIKTKCETDCSAMVAACCISAGAKISPDCYTGNLKAACKATGKFEILTDKKYLKDDKYLKKGDIILNEKSHVIVALENGSKVTTAKKTTTTKTTAKKTTPTTTTKKVTVTVKPISTGKVSAKSGLNIRSKASLKGKVVKTVKKGTSLSCYATKKADGYTWWAINKGKTQWAVAKWIKKA